MAVKMQKAKILVSKIDNTKYKVEEIPVMFNPSEYKINKTANYAKSNVQGKGSKSEVYQNGNAATLTVQLFFDFDKRYTSDGEKSSDSIKDVRKYTERILQLLRPQDSTKLELARPPICAFVWGTFCFIGHVSSVTQSFNRFTKDGIPVRATVDLTFTENKGSTINNKTEDEIKQQYGEIEVNWQEELCTQTTKPWEWRQMAERAGILNPRKEGKKNRPNSVNSLNSAKYNIPPPKEDEPLEDIRYLFEENEEKNKGKNPSGSVRRKRK